MLKTEIDQTQGDKSKEAVIDADGFQTVTGKGRGKFKFNVEGRSSSTRLEQRVRPREDTNKPPRLEQGARLEKENQAIEKILKLTVSVGNSFHCLTAVQDGELEGSILLRKYPGDSILIETKETYVEEDSKMKGPDVESDCVSM
ncbi:hypothetical protein Pint_18334 [Pistacia integerrima]|uniref:Uncharacterized protein n=1 Tax=Pistacia integerrima TaxID=434235 RepID=A0ACC0YZ56_9ROSI|nr:hypothetical protein Pint_18334 [Pistacia integerrima]